MPKKELLLEGLTCANCAAKIECEVNELRGVHASMNFLNKTLTIETESEAEIQSSITQAIAIIHKHEPDISVKEKNNKHAKQEEENGDNRKIQVLKLAIGGALFAIGLSFDFQNWLELAIFLTSYLIVGGDVVLRAVKGMVKGQVFSEHFLMSVATIGAFFIGEYAEGVAVMLFYLVGEMCQDMAVDHSRKSISALMDIRPDYANLKVGNKITKVPPEAVQIGDLIVIKPGEKIPLDGTVIDGISLADTSALTGESMPRELEPGKEALSGFMNRNGVLTVEVTKRFSDSTVSRILDLVENASSRKAPTEQFITKFARFYTPVVVVGAAALAMIPPLVIPGALFSEWIYRALIFLVVSCPCALVISIPLGFFGGIGSASKQGILIKGSNYLEALNSVDTIVFDKTGTLTKGAFIVTQVNPEETYSKERLLEYAAYAESYSNHPIARSIISAYHQKIDESRIRNYQETAGNGIHVTIDDNEVIVGNKRLMNNEGICFKDNVDTTGTVVHLAVNHQYAGHLVISDEVKDDSIQAIKAIKALGIRRTVMLTGDSKTAGEKIGSQLGLDEVYTELLPDDKVEKFEWLQSKKSPNEKMMFVGDGINDAPVLARADIGVAMGGLGSDAAIEAADVVIMTDEPSKIATAIRIAKKTRVIVLENIVFALGVKSIFLALGALGLASMWEAVFADVGVALIAIFNALRVLKTKKF
jgi:Cd2+/Zn2+-exporting ATPase